MSEPTLKIMLQWLRDDFVRLESKVDTLQGFRWKVIGYASAFGALSGVLMGILL